MMASTFPFSIVRSRPLMGPNGSGKSTLAYVLASKTDRRLDRHDAIAAFLS
jgi:Fe-S cluster assembly ATPase SufC